MPSAKTSLVALLSVFAVAIDGIAVSPFTIKRESAPIPAVAENFHAAPHGTINTISRMPSFLLGIPISNARNLTASSTSDGNNLPITDDKPFFAAIKPVISAVGSPIMANNRSINANTAAAAAAASDDVPIPEWDDPGYRIKCINSSSPPPPSDGGDPDQKEDFKEAFDCWFYHRTRCFSGLLTSLDPRCKHDCVCERNDFVGFDRATKGNHGAGLGGVCVSKPNPHYSEEDGGCA